MMCQPGGENLSSEATQPWRSLQSHRQSVMFAYELELVLPHVAVMVLAVCYP